MTSARIKYTDLEITDFNPFYQGYVNWNKNMSLFESLSYGLSLIDSLFLKLDHSKLATSYAPSKWTIAEVLVHLADAERVFQYRALRFSRRDKTPLAGFDENEYVPQSNASNRTVEALKKELIDVRVSTISMFESFSEDQLKCKGSASGSDMSVAAAGFIIAGHLMHHFNIIETRYLKELN